MKVKEESQGKTRTPQQNRSQKTRMKMLSAGRELFTEKGYQQTNSKEITRKAGVATGSFYAYFQDKGEVFLEITKIYYQQIFGEVQSVMENIEPSIPRSVMIKSLVYALYKAHDIEPELHREISMMILAGTNTTATDTPDQKLCKRVLVMVEEMDKLVQTWLEELMKKWDTTGEKREYKTAAALIFRTTEETIHRLKQFPSSMPDPGKVLDELVKMLEHYLVNYYS